MSEGSPRSTSAGTQRWPEERIAKVMRMEESIRAHNDNGDRLVDALLDLRDARAALAAVEQRAASLKADLQFSIDQHQDSIQKWCAEETAHDETKAQLAAAQAQCAMLREVLDSARGFVAGVTPDTPRLAPLYRHARDEMDKALADTAASAVSWEAARLEPLRAELAALRGAVVSALAQWRQPDEGPSEHFERLAEQFYRETGLMAPGKSQPLEMGNVDNENERRDAWTEFLHAPIGKMAAAVADSEAAAHAWESTVRGRAIEECADTLRRRQIELGSEASGISQDDPNGSARWHALKDESEALAEAESRIRALSRGSGTTPKEGA